MQLVDLFVNGRKVNSRQRSDNPALLTRIKTAIQTAHEVIIRPSGSPPPAPKPTPENNLLAGKGLFTAWQANAANSRGADWIAIQADPEGNHGGFNPGTARVLAWEARASRGMEAVNALGAVGYIGQAESPSEFAMCMALGNITVPKYLVGKPNGWGNSVTEISFAMAEAKAKGWGLLVEWYWNEQNELVNGPDSSGYTVDACLFGCYEPATGERKYLDQYRKVWAGNYGCYAAETMSSRDWAAFV